MIPYNAFSDLLFTYVDGPQAEIVDLMLSNFNTPTQWTTYNAHGGPVVKYYAKEANLDFSLAYVNKAERDTTKLQRVLFWEPRIHPGKTVLMGVFHDGLSHTVYRLSELSPYTWINVRIYEDTDFPGCFFSYYADRRRILRRLVSCKDDGGWVFLQKGPLQTFETTDYYLRRNIKDRLNREIITEYLEALGCLVRLEGFWETVKPAHFLWQDR
jgi:hypothetical protein